MSEFIEDRFNLHEKPTLEIDLSRRDLALPGIKDFDEPGYKNIFLVADPEIFNPYTGQITSANDRMLHYGLTREETFSLESAVANDAPREYRLLRKLFYEPYKDQRILVGEINELATESIQLRKHTIDKTAAHALDKLLSMSDSAQRYKLGIFLDSE